ncbi:hypothetical protein GCM10027347_44650 [Larkinella harenae]
MANNINLGPARIVRASIMHTMENGRKFNNIGTLQALRSPQNATLTEAMSATYANKNQKMSFVQGSGGEEDIIARVSLNYTRQWSPTSKRSSRQVTQPGANGLDRPAAPTTVNVDYALHKEYEIEFKTIDFATMEDEAESYFESLNNNVSGSAGEYKMLGQIGAQFADSVEEGLLSPINAAALAAVISGIGTNLVTNTNTATEIYLYDKEGRKRDDFFDFLGNIKTVHGINGKLIVIGGLKLVTYMRKQKIVGINDLGTDAAKMYNELPIEWYYDPAIDTALGQDKILIMSPNSACLQTILEHVHIVKQKEVAQTSFGFAALQIAPYDADTFALDLDFRVRSYDTTKYPKWVFTPSARFGLFTRPAGYYKTYGGWQTVTGIFQAQLVNVEPDAEE